MSQRGRGAEKASAKIQTGSSDRQTPGAESARRTIEMLFAFTRQRHTLTPRELAEITGIPLPTVYRYVAFLREEGLLVLADGGGVHLSTRFTAMAEAADAAEPLIELSDLTMRRVAEESGETVILVRLMGGSATCVHRIESTHTLRISYELGQPLPLERGATARLFLASLPESVFEERMDQLAEVDPARAQILRKDVALARVNGWATSHGELDPGIFAVAAAITRGGETAAVLSVPTPLSRVTDDVRTELITSVRRGAAEISERLESGGAASD